MGNANNRKIQITTCFSATVLKKRETLETTVEDIVNREGLNDIGDIDFRVLSGSVEGMSKQGQNELVGALRQYIKCTGRFSQI